MKRFNRQLFTNICLIILITFVTIAIMLSSFASKALRYEETANTVPLRVQKDEYQITAQTIGTVSNVLVQPGEHVSKGQELVDLTNSVLDHQITLLQQLSPNNGSASIELVDLETQKAAQRIYAPTDGIVSDIVSEGDPINTAQRVATIYSDDSMSIVGQFDPSEYSAVQQNSGNLTIFDDRLQTTFPVLYEGAREVVTTQNNPNGNVTLVFTLTNSSDAINLLENEKVELQLSPPETSTKPIDQFVEWYKNHILGVTETTQ
jgi:biotin carboxyl carrier protein